MEKIISPTMPSFQGETAWYLIDPLFSQLFYEDRTNRNQGWITAEEQMMFVDMDVAVAGCGGMGGSTLASLVRMGVRNLRFADNEKFDVSNLNRQYGATMETLGKSKAFETARMLHEITRDTRLLFHLQGINEETVEEFVKGTDLICDEIEFWAVGSRILLHQVARRHGVTLLTCPTVGHRVYVTKFTPDSMTMEEVLEMDYPEAMSLQLKIQNGTASVEEMKKVMRVMLRFVAPEIPEYCVDLEQYSTVTAVTERLKNGVASIFASNPPMAAGFLTNQVAFHLLERSHIKRKFVLPPPMPGYVMFDAGLLETKRQTGKWW